MAVFDPPRLHTSETIVSASFTAIEGWRSTVYRSLIFFIIPSPKQSWKTSNQFWLSRKRSWPLNSLFVKLVSDCQQGWFWWQFRFSPLTKMILIQLQCNPSECHKVWRGLSRDDGSHHLLAFVHSFPIFMTVYQLRTTSERAHSRAIVHFEAACGSYFTCSNSPRMSLKWSCLAVRLYISKLQSEWEITWLSLFTTTVAGIFFSLLYQTES